MTLESEIYSIEAANINKETLDAMKNASSAMKQIHGGLTIDKVDQTMYAGGMIYFQLGNTANNPVQGRVTRTTCYWRGNRRGYYTVYRQLSLRRNRTG